MSVVKELIRTEANGAISFGNYELDKKSKLSDFEHDGDMYKVKTYNEITKLERNGMFVYEKDANGNDIISMVKYVPINSFKNEQDLNKIIDPFVKKSILQVLAKRKQEGKSFEAAIAEPIWLLDKDCNEIKQDKKGRKLWDKDHKFM